MSKKNNKNIKIVAENRKARYNYELSDFLESGIELKGTEVKSLRSGKANIAESYASFEGGELWVVNSYISEYSQGNRFNHATRRLRKLLLKKKELKRLFIAVSREGMTIIPLKLYFNAEGRVKLEIALGKGKKNYDKRDVEKKRDWGREKSRILKNALS